MKLLVKYDIIGIQNFVFRTEKFTEIGTVQNIPEKILFESFKIAADSVFNLNIDKQVSDLECIKILETKGIHILDRTIGTAYVLFEGDNAKSIYENISKKMAFFILKKTYSLELVHCFVECTEDFFNDYKKLNNSFRKLKSSMPSACHIGAFPICRHEAETDFPIIGKESYGKDIKKDITMEYALKKNLENYFFGSKGNNIYEKIKDSHIAVICIDGNDIGKHISEILSKANYDNIKEIFSSIKVKERFSEVCSEMADRAEKYIQKNNKDTRLIHTVIRAGDSVTYVVRADIALSFARKFIELISEKYMIDNTNDPKYLISVCAGIAYINNRFPFSDGYSLAKACCSNAKSRAKANKSSLGYTGNWIDFEICRHIKDVDLLQNRKIYGVVGNTLLYKKPYCIKHNLYHNDFFDFDVFEKKIQSLLSSQPILNRARAKTLRETYYRGYEYVKIFENSALSRNYLCNDSEKKITFYDNYISDENTSKLYASYYDAIEIMDLYIDFNKDFDKNFDKEG